MPASPSTLLDMPANAAMAPAFSPLYQQIKALLLQSLQDAEWKPGEVIPSELELAARYKVSQGTVRKAIDELAAEHLLVRRQGRGTFVATHAERGVQYRFLRLRPDAGEAADEGPTQRLMHDLKKLRAPAEIARQLGLRTGDSVLQVRRLLALAGTPTILEDIWLSAAAFKGLSVERLAAYSGPTYALFEQDFGVRMVRATERIRAVQADAEQAQMLQVRAGEPLLSVERLTFTYNDAPMELRRGLYRTDTHHYFNELN